MLVLIALGGAGLAVAADRQQTPDENARPYLAKLTADLATIETAVADLAGAGRASLGNLQSLSVDGARSSMVGGDEALATISYAVAGLQADQAAAGAHIERWRLGPETSEQMTALDAAVDSVADCAPQWMLIKARATLVMQLLDTLTQHDSQVFRATTAGRQSQWSEALNELDAAAGSVGDARRVRDQLALDTTVVTLDGLLSRYDTYDGALRSLYEYLGSGGAQNGDQFDALQRAVQDAQSALPADNRALSVIVADAAGTRVGDALVALEHDRDKVDDAVRPAASVGP